MELIAVALESVLFDLHDSWRGEGECPRSLVRSMVAMLPCCLVVYSIWPGCEDCGKVWFLNSKCLLCGDLDFLDA